ncbi:MAG: acylhydrolase [Butyrivibrio sp.]|nr:acylhydrolase [Butyrivibrio sp.]
MVGVDPAQMPLFVAMFKGISDGMMPWDAFSYKGSSSGQGEATGGDAAANGDALKDDNTQAGNVSGNDASGNEAEETYELTEVTEDYFDDALFIGDSRTVGLSEYCEELSARATFYAQVSLSIHKVLEKDFIETDEGKITVEQALEDEEFAKIYIMLGLNEMGVGDVDTFINKYGEVLARIRELQPNAIIYIQGIMHVSEQKSEKDKIFNNPSINERNEALKQFANGKDIFYIDMNEAIDDENGNLIADLTNDGVHLKASAYQGWYEFLLHHAIVKK